MKTSSWAFFGAGLALIVISLITGLRKRERPAKIAEEAMLSSLLSLAFLIDIVPPGIARKAVVAAVLLIFARGIWLLLRSARR